MPAVMIIVLAFLLLLLATVVLGFSGFIEKVDGIEAADRAALAIGFARADAMNRVITLNHEAGERLSWAIVGAAVSGRNASRSDLLEGSADEADGLDSTIRRRASELQALGGATPAASMVSNRLESGAATGIAKLTLKRALADEYGQRLANGILDVGPNELAILHEWRAIDTIEREASEAVAAIDHLADHAVPLRLRQANAISESWPLELADQCDRLGRELGVEVATDPDAFNLPVLAEPNDTPSSRSQLVASAWPWVRYHRGPILARFRRLSLSRAGDHYLEWCVRMTPSLALEVYRDGAPPMRMLIDSSPELLGQEPWRSDPDRAALRFAALAFIFDRPDRPMSFGAMRDQHPEGRLSHAQVMIHPNRVINGRPAPWDTLAWDRPVPSFPDDSGPIVEPGSRRSWTARLVPVTRLNQVANALSSPFREPATSVIPAPRALQTH